jgi:hypothetical protein
LPRGILGFGSAISEGGALSRGGATYMGYDAR